MQASLEKVAVRKHMLWSILTDRDHPPKYFCNNHYYLDGQQFTAKNTNHNIRGWREYRSPQQILNYTDAKLCPYFLRFAADVAFCSCDFLDDVGVLAWLAFVVPLPRPLPAPNASRDENQGKCA